ncbi:sigma factor regulator FemR [Pectobacterium araliae]|uniref:FecR family protein n=1 Tax=Pectobacterium araliae TaxID=3073862 RepID=A0AAN0KB72_9GAMM|nr:FecR family protein [Pectobacterium sp. MAFF 302110]GKW20235.1 sigma factor regulator FemR [Pectobacterium carotovorum subsp. carotovorum]
MIATPDPIAQQAIEWMVLVHSGEMTDEQWRSFERWRNTDVEHDKACRMLESMLGNVPLLVTSPDVRRTIQKRGSRRQFVLGVLALAAGGTLSGWVYHRQAPLSGLLADLHTKTGERSQQLLTDGSQLTLNARSVVDLAMSNTQRQIRLLQGQIYIDAQVASVPLTIATHHGEIVLERGILNVAQQSQGARVSALSNPVRLLNHRNDTYQLRAGQSVLMSQSGFEPLRVVAKAESAWINGLIEMNEQPLGQLVDEIRNYRQGVIRVSPEAARLRISGIFSLDDINRTFESLVQTFPINIHRTTDYWVNISKRA